MCAVLFANLILYGIVGWGSASKIHVLSLETVQRRFIKPYISHVPEATGLCGEQSFRHETIYSCVPVHETY